MELFNIYTGRSHMYKRIIEMKTLKCPRINEAVRTDITQENCIAYHQCFDDDLCPLAGCFSKMSAGKEKEVAYSASNLESAFGDGI
jgi:hypothetical protein